MDKVIFLALIFIPDSFVTKSINLIKNGINIELKQSDIYISNNRSYINPEKIAKKFGYRYYYDAYYKVFTLDNKFLFGY